MSSSKELLSRIRKLNWLLSESQVGYVSFDELCHMLAEMLHANVYVISKKGKILACVREAGGGTPFVEDDGNAVFPKESNDNIIKVSDSVVNITYEDVKKIYGDEYDDEAKYHIIEPVTCCGERIGTMMVARPDVKFTEEDAVICELGSTIVGIEMAKGLADEEKEDLRGREAVRMAIDKLSYSELAAVQKVFDELEEDDSLFVASKVADKYKLTRSVIVNALRKLESAGVINTRSLGMKGTRIKIINPYLRDQIGGIEF